MTEVDSSIPSHRGSPPANPRMAASANDAVFRIPASSIQRVLRGVLQATKISEKNATPIIQWMETCSSNPMPGLPRLGIFLPPKDWKEKMISELASEAPQLRHIATTALAISFLRERRRQKDGETIEAEELAFVWGLIYEALTVDVRPPLFAVSRSAQGFLSIPLCSQTKNGSIDELYRLHVWMPDGKRGNLDFAVHSHQTLIQSWILAGEGKDQQYQIDLDPDPSTATHAQYSLAWNDGKQTGATYAPHQQFSVVTNTLKLARAVPLSVNTHLCGMTYSIPAGAFHRTIVQPDGIHATIAVFNSQSGFITDAPVLGPINAASFTQYRDPAGTTAIELARAVQSLRSWEDLVRQSKSYAQQAQWENALQSLNSALHMCDVVPVFQNARIYRQVALGELGGINRRLGRYDIAIEILETTLREMAASERSLELSGELGVIYRHRARLEDAKRVLEIQYATAKELGSERARCRAVGNLGMVNYQLYLKSNKKELLEEAFQQQLERIEGARRLGIPMWESIGLVRLSLCHAARGDTELAVEACLASLDLSRRLKDTTVIAMSHFFCGHALWLNRQRDEAFKHFNNYEGCTPAIAFCKEPSEEHLGYLQELVEVGVDMDVSDEHGYNALDYAVFSGHAETEECVLRGLRKTLAGNTERQLLERLDESRLRKCYRELFQETLRPILLSRDSVSGVKNLRLAYASALAADPQKRKIFATLRYVYYRDFRRLGRFPRLTDNITRKFNPDADVDTSLFLIFYSYRWLKTSDESTGPDPDDENGTQFKRMDIACINQKDPKPGVASLPMVVAQCNALISLVDDTYYDRAWCAVEVMILQSLRRPYGLHLWYEHNISGVEGSTGALRAGPSDLAITIADKKLSFEEEDRPKVTFLERQSKLLG
ncbi:hypothetical protein ACHAQH_010031 [Verticillium albo-atrum]